MINVVVTGNAPYRENKHNTSRMIRDALPNIIERPGHPDIHVLKYHRDSRDVYEDILHMVDDIWTARRDSFLPKPNSDDADEYVDIAFSLHLGMTTAIPEFRAEKIAYRDGYERPGEDGVFVDKEHFKKRGLPAYLSPTFDSDMAVARVSDSFPGIPVRASANPNQGFCEYRLYASLAEVEVNHTAKRGHAAFFHVPADQSSEAIALGAKVVAAYITALANQISSTKFD